MTICTLKRANAANPKKRVTDSDATNIANFASGLRQPRHHPMLTHYSGVVLMPHSSPNVSRHESTATVQIVSSVMIKIKKELWLWMPTQLLIQGQWWS